MKYMMPYTLPIAERGESTGDEEGGPTAYFPVRRGPPDEVHGALSTF